MAYAEYLRKSRYDNPDETLEETLARHRKLLAEYMVRNNISVLPEDIYEEVVSGDSYMPARKCSDCWKQWKQVNMRALSVWTSSASDAVP